MLSNRPLTDLPELRAIRTRISHLHLQATDQEIAALMRKIARNGFQHGEQSMTSQECQDVCEYLIAESQTRLCHLDMRLLDNGFRDYLQWKAGHSTSHWQELVATRLDGRRDELVVFPVTASRMKTCGPWRPSSLNSLARWRPRWRGAGCDPSPGRRFSGTREHLKKGPQDETSWRA